MTNAHDELSLFAHAVHEVVRSHARVVGLRELASRVVQRTTKSVALKECATNYT